jgi:FMN phosphatase YigB (HAD superfamily)
MKIFLDFDDTLFNTFTFTGDFWSDLVKIIERGGWSVELIDRTGDEFSSASFEGRPTYSVEKHLALLNEREPSDRLEVVLEDVRFFMHDLERYLFPDVVPFLTLNQKEELFILTYGEPGFQKDKISGAGIEPYFHEILVSEGQSKLSLIRQYVEVKNFPVAETIVFVDDKEKYFEPMKVGDREIVTVLMDRKEILEGKRADYWVKDCTELPLILKSLR